jgi:short subunit dehydrogenase-like uncharacterized protein
MMIETALLLQESDALPPGIWTPGAAFKDRLIERLIEHGDLRFEAYDG